MRKHVTHTYKYGTATVVGFDGKWRAEVYRPFAVNPREPWNAEVYERVMSDGEHDDSPRHETYPTGYDSRCSCCWLNISHTEMVHAGRVANSLDNNISQTQG